MRVWIDMANSPHPLLFAPVARRLVEQGAEVLITVRNHAQTLELTRQRWPEAEILGAPGRDGRLGKLGSLARRVAECRTWARRRRPHVALSHNSYAQIVAARLVGVPVVTGMDYEHQPMNHLAFRGASRILVPEAVPAGVIRRQGATGAKTIRYPGLKEELYLADFEPDPGVLDVVGVSRQAGEAVVVVRSAPVGSAYHPDENPRFVDGLRYLAAQQHVRCVVLARHESQRQEIEGLDLPNCVIPKRAVDGRSLLCAADLFIGAGGTMCREAALLGVPTLSMFAGRPAAVDGWLERQGRMARFERPDQLDRVRPRANRAADLARLRSAAEPIQRVFIEATAAAGALDG
ncbi:MAG: hypothetical protein BroJett022_03910 [Actinomycetes bacterium]|nr:MAG: hypothetical protein BroJett022_03910 [Actinomycetes bacterium]